MATAEVSAERFLVPGEPKLIRILDGLPLMEEGVIR
jgi:hypothetical protein